MKRPIMGRSRKADSRQRARSEANALAARCANDQIVLHAGEFSRNLLTGAFRSMFHVERAIEIAEPGVFDADSELDQLDMRRMDAVSWRHFPLFLANEELTKKRFSSYNEYIFVLVLDLSRSMTLGWADALDEGPGVWRRHTFYRLKFVAYSLLLSAYQEGYTSRVLLFRQGTPISWESPDDEGFAYATLEYLDDVVSQQDAGSGEPSPVWSWQETLEELTTSSRQQMVTLVSDFLDPVQDHCNEEVFLGLLTELRFRHRLLVLQINNLRDLSLPSAGESASTFSLHYEEDGSERMLGARAAQKERESYREWLGGVGRDAVISRFAAALASYGIGHRRLVPEERSGEHLDSLTWSTTE